MESVRMVSIANCSIFDTSVAINLLVFPFIKLDTYRRATAFHGVIFLLFPQFTKQTKSWTVYSFGPKSPQIDAKIHRQSMFKSI
ncbi:MAG TPA: hypothetical protein DHW38_11975 [Planctomycetaceae bacterium]|nr:hypothetical protein [Planctomycetaceae bacterium]